MGKGLQGGNFKRLQPLLAAGAQGYTFAKAGEIMSTYSGWAANDLTAFKKWMKDVFAPKNLDFMKRHQGTCSDHYWSNWDLVNMCFITSPSES